MMQSGLYRKGPYGEEGTRPFSREKAIKEIPRQVISSSSLIKRNSSMGRGNTLVHCLVNGLLRARPRSIKRLGAEVAKKANMVYAASRV